VTWKVRYLEEAEWWLETLDHKSWRTALSLIDEGASYARVPQRGEERSFLERDGLFVRLVWDHATGVLVVTHVSEDDERDSRRPGGLLERPEPWDDE
jgi:hypothetical protein